LTKAYGCLTGPPEYLSWRASTTTQCHTQIYSPGRGQRIWLLYIWLHRDIQ